MRIGAPAIRSAASRHTARVSPCTRVRHVEIQARTDSCETEPARNRQWRRAAKRGRAVAQLTGGVAAPAVCGTTARHAANRIGPGPYFRETEPAHDGNDPR